MANTWYLQQLRSLKNNKTKDPILQNLSRSLSNYLEIDQSPLALDLPPFNDYECLPTPQKWLATADFIGEDYHYLRAKSGDCIIVHGWAGDMKNAVAFNEQNRSSGWIPSIYLSYQGPVQTLNESFLARQNYASEPEWNRYLKWKRGERVRICYWIDRKSFSGVGFNMKTSQIGDFDIHDRNCSIETGR